MPWGYLSAVGTGKPEATMTMTAAMDRDVLDGNLLQRAQESQTGAKVYNGPNHTAKARKK